MHGALAGTNCLTSLMAVQLVPPCRINGLGLQASTIRNGGGPFTPTSPRKCEDQSNVIQTHSRMMPRNVLERN